MSRPPTFNILLINLSKRISQRGGKRIRRIWRLIREKEREFFTKERVIQCQGCSELRKNGDQGLSTGLSSVKIPGGLRHSQLLPEW